MPTDPHAASDAAEKAAQAAGKIDETQEALQKMKGKMDVMSAIGEDLQQLSEDLKHMDTKEKFKRVCGFVAASSLRLIFSEEDMKHYMEGHDEIPENETLEDTQRQTAYNEERDEARRKKESGEELTDEEEIMLDPEADEEVSRKQTYVNMAAIRYYKKDGSRFKKLSGLSKVLVQKEAVPSLFILKSSGALFKEGLGSFADFKENVVSKLVHKSVTDPKERIRQAAVILSCCAVGRFQIIPYFHFKKMDWSLEGEEGLMNMYNFIRSNERQVNCYKSIIKPSLAKYKDAGLVAVAYYAGGKTARAYEKNPDDPRFHKKQYRGHASIHEYAVKAKAYFEKYKNKIQGLTELDYVAMALERIESGGTFIYQMARRGGGIEEGAKEPALAEAGEEGLTEEARLRMRIVERARAYSGSDRFQEDFEKRDYLKGGALGCAWVVTTILKEAGVIDHIWAGTESAENELKKRGWKEASIEEAEPGDIVFWAKIGQKIRQTSDGPEVYGGHRHVGVVIGENLAISNSSTTKRPKTHKIRSNRPVDKILKPPEKLNLDMAARRKKENPPAPKGAKGTNYEELSPAVRQAAVAAQREMRGLPIGSQREVEIEGKKYILQRQWHFNRDPNGAPGTGVFEAPA